MTFLPSGSGRSPMGIRTISPLTESTETAAIHRKIAAGPHGTNSEQIKGGADAIQSLL